MPRCSGILRDKAMGDKLFYNTSYSLMMIEDKENTPVD